MKYDVVRALFTVGNRADGTFPTGLGIVGRDRYGLCYSGAIDILIGPPRQNLVWHTTFKPLWLLQLRHAI